MKYTNPKVLTLTNDESKLKASAKVCILRYFCLTYNSSCKDGYSHCDLNYDENPKE